MLINTKIINSVLTCLSVLIFSGCVVTSEMYQGHSVSPEQIVAIQQPGPHKDSIDNFDIIINYEFTRIGDVLEISGQAALAERYPLLYERLKYLYVYLFFLDDASRVLETVSLAKALTGRTDERLVFSQSLSVPAGAVGISFGYNGEVQEGGRGDAASHTFYLLPLK